MQHDELGYLEQGDEQAIGEYGEDEDVKDPIRSREAGL